MHFKTTQIYAKSVTLWELVLLLEAIIVQEGLYKEAWAFVGVMSATHREATIVHL